MSDAPPSRTLNNIQRPRLLLVDDEPSVLRGLRRVLETNQPFWEITTARDGEEALELMRKQAFDVIITDLHMPHLNGISLLLRVSQAYPRTVRIVHSSRCETLEATSFARLVQRRLPKPATSMDILEAMSWALHKRAELEAPPSSRCA